MTVIRFLGNILWLLLGGIIGALLWFMAGLLVCITIIGIPFGLQCFKIAGFILWPFGRDIEVGSFGIGGLFGNILWILILGIPFGIQHFKLALLAILPFGAKIIKRPGHLVPRAPQSA